MARYIDADKLLKNWCESICKPKPNCSDDCFIYSEITNAPSADVRENVRGNWIEKEVIDDRKDAKIPQWQQAQCSICGKWNTTPYMYYFDEFDFCPNCGADMRGDKDG